MIWSARSQTACSDERTVKGWSSKACFQFTSPANNEQRVWGIKEVAILRIIWWDPEHSVCSLAKKHPSKRRRTVAAVPYRTKKAPSMGRRSQSVHAANQLLRSGCKETIYRTLFREGAVSAARSDTLTERKRHPLISTYTTGEAVQERSMNSPTMRTHVETHIARIPGPPRIFIPSQSQGPQKLYY
jgi:hypothetical protein